LAAVEAGLKIFRPSKSLNQQGEIIIRQTVFVFKIEKTEEELTDHGGLALLAKYNHGTGLRELSDRHLPRPGGNRGMQHPHLWTAWFFCLRLGRCEVISF